MTNVKKWRGLKSLVQAAVDQGSLAIERVQKGAAKRPFAIVESIPPIAGPAAAIHLLHDAAISGVHGAIRLVNRAVGDAFEVVFDVVDDEPQGARDPAEKSRPPPLRS